MKKIKESNLNVRQQLYKKYRLEGYSKYTAARKAGYSHAYASQAKRVENAINMDYWLEREGLTDTALAKHAFEGLNANRSISAIVGTDATGKTMDFIDVPDWSARHKYFETILKITGKLKNLIIDQSQHIHVTYAYIRNPKSVEKERDRTPLIGNSR